MATVEICKKFRFESAHWLPGFAVGHKCRRLHGHSFRVDVYVAGPVQPTTGVVMDYGDIKKIVAPYIELLDHRCLNELGDERQDPLLQNPTSENLAIWFYRTLQPLLPGLSRVVVHETCTSLCSYSGQ